MASVLSEEEFLCVICLDCFTDPVSIPCGHNFCLKCIKRLWDIKPQSDCPLCKELFQVCPDLRINVGLKDITEKFKRSLREKTANKPVPAKRQTSRQSSKSEDIPCDVCHGNKLTAVKSCLVCQASYCEMHLAPHLRDPVMTKHRLTDPATFATSHLCRNHNKPLEMFCKREQTPVCVKCMERDHKHHEVVPIEKESKRIMTQMKTSQAEIQRMIQDRIRKTDEIKHSVELNRKDKETEIQTSVQFATMIISAVERNQALLIDEIEKKHETAEKRAEELLSELEEEITELQSRCSELQYLEDTKDPLHLLQSFPCLSAPPSTKDWSEVRAEPDIYIRTVRSAFSKLVDICHELELKLSTEEVGKVSEYAVDVILDPATAAGWLVLSPDGKKVSLGSQQRRLSLPHDHRRFDSCVAVLGKQSFTSGRRYWVVQVGDKTDWDLGVATESINRKGSITVRPDNGYWAICRRKGGSLRACAGPSITLNLYEPPQKVGILLDYEEGSVSFYNTEAKTHIYTYRGCKFTEPLYPYFNPCLHDNGRNMEPLVVCPVKAGQTVETAAL
ncbi:E3 ubiquitin-protein ligase TRIM21-like [Odontesthes bonariensis]|uniref:E3 ubiquitin-protein ligase TRIM21-like n=1 Tax=Odontesthes bonariensis TaxID=219752 RepID=UPI003F586B8B